MSSAPAQFPYHFRDPELFARALTVRAANRREPDNQRLEFLGDAVLGLLIAERLYQLHPQADEGRLTEMRLRLVSGKALLKHAERLGVGKLLVEYNLGYTWSQKAVVDATEALIGAAWLEGGASAARQVVEALYTDDELLSVTAVGTAADNPKGALQQFALNHYQCEPSYAVVAQDGPRHAPTFRCSATLAGRTAEGVGTSRKGAEAEAARALLELLLSF